MPLQIMTNLLLSLIQPRFGNSIVGTLQTVKLVQRPGEVVSLMGSLTMPALVQSAGIALKCTTMNKLDSQYPFRDEYLVVDYRNIKLLAQFLKDYNGEILTSFDTGVCQEQWLNIRVALEKAKDHGYLDLTPPFVEYDYEKYMVH